MYLLASGVLVNTEGSVDASTVDSLALLVKTAHGGTHTLGGNEDNVDVRAELLADALLQNRCHVLRFGFRGMACCMLSRFSSSSQH
jgi:hypothetical protein